TLPESLRLRCRPEHGLVAGVAAELAYPVGLWTHDIERGAAGSPRMPGDVGAEALPEWFGRSFGSRCLVLPGEVFKRSDPWGLRRNRALAQPARVRRLSGALVLSGELLQRRHSWSSADVSS